MTVRNYPVCREEKEGTRCRKCGRAITSGSFCDECREQVENELRRVSGIFACGGSCMDARMHIRNSGRK